MSITSLKYHAYWFQLHSLSYLIQCLVSLRQSDGNVYRQHNYMYEFIVDAPVNISHVSLHVLVVLMEHFSVLGNMFVLFTSISK